MWISVSGPFSFQQLSDWTRYKIKDRIQQVPGVGDVQLGGWLERNVRLWFDRTKLDAHGLTIAEALANFRAQHQELPAGRLETAGRETDVRVLGEALDLDELKRLVVGGTPDRPVRLEDVALVEDGFADQRMVSRNSGITANALGVKKQRGENTVAVADRVKKALEEMRPTLPAGMKVAVNYDQTDFIKKSVHEVERELLLAMILTSLVCLLFLGSFSAAANVILAIPMSVLGTIAVLQACGFTLNTFTLLALALVVGIVVDDAIMVQENISRHRDLGLPAPEAARRGTRQIAFAALAATVAVIAIFLPVAFMGGLMGKFLAQFGIALCVAVGLSYLEAVTLAPARCAQFLALGGESKNAMQRASERAFAGLGARYRVVLGWSLRHPWLTLLMALMVFGGSFASLSRLGFETSPSQDQSSLFVRIETDTGASLAETDRLFQRAEAWLNSRPEVEREFTIVGLGGAGVNSGVMFVTLKPPSERKLSQEQFQAVAHDELNSYAGCKATVQDPSKGGFGGGRGYPIEFSVRGSDWTQLTDATKGLMERMRSSDTVELKVFFGLFTQKVKAGDVFTDIDSDYQLGKPELTVVPDRERAQDLGISVADIGEAINAMVGGVKVGKFSSGGRRLDIRARLLADQRLTPEDLASYRVRAASGALVPLSSVVRLEERSALQTITHKEHGRAIAIFANTKPGHSQYEGMQVINELAKSLPEGASLVAQGSSAQMQQTFFDFLITFLLGLVIAYLILAAQFDSFIHPITVLTVLPLAVAGAAFSLQLGGFSLNTFSLIGILLLMGIVKKNSIILVDYADKARAEGKDAVEAMLHAGAVRLRPILMTSAATMMAAVPTALGLGAGAETRQPMAVAVFGGVLLSTLLSLVVVPAFYLVADRIWGRIVRAFRRLTGRPAAAAPEREDQPAPSA
jgi:hydrophobe/amphiphile efflux-1 (HAE1) family protein